MIIAIFPYYISKLLCDRMVAEFNDSFWDFKHNSLVQLLVGNFGSTKDWLVEQFIAWNSWLIIDMHYLYICLSIYITINWDQSTNI